MFNIYLTNLAKYNEGYLIGEWVSLPIEENELEEILKRILGEDEEIFITDYENDYNYKVGEYESLTNLNDLAEQLESIERSVSVEVIKAAFDEYGNGEEALRKLIEGDFTVLYDVSDDESLGDQLIEEGYLGEIPDNLQFYIDAEAVGRDYTCNGDFTIYPKYNIAVCWQ